MKLKLVIYIYIFLYSGLFAQPAFQWARSFGGVSDDGPGAVTVDAFSNVYTAGLFRGMADVDPGSGVFNVSSQGVTDIFITKLNASGNFIWAKSLGGIGAEECSGLITDPTGNIYMSGEFCGIVDFDPGPGTHTLASVSTFTGFPDNFILKLDPAGNLLWAISFGGHKTDVLSSMTLDESGNILAAGYFTDSTDFDPGPALYTLAPVTYDIYILKLDSSGNFIWVKTFSGQSPNVAWPNDIVTDNQGNVYTTGIFVGPYDFDPGASTFIMTSVSTHDAFVSKLDASGNFVWAKKFSTTLTGSGNSTDGSAIALDEDKHVYCSGSYLGSTDFNPGVGTYTLPYIAGYDIYVTKLDSAGNFIWAKGINGSGLKQVHDMEVTPNGNTYLNLSSNGIPDFDPGVGTYTLATAGIFDVFVAQLDSAGVFGTAGRIGGVHMDLGGSIEVDPFGSIYLSGYFYSPIVDFDPGVGSYTINTLGANINSDFFVVKLGDCFTPTATVNYPSVICTGSVTSYSINPIPLAQNYVWSAPSALNLLASQNSITLTLVPGTTILNLSVTPVNSCGSASTTVLAIPVNTIPVIQVSNGSICIGESFTIVPSGAFSYSYSGGTNVVSPLSNTVYTISGSSPGGCISQQATAITVSVMPLPIITVTTSSQTICVGEVAVLIASGGSTYNWSNGIQTPSIEINPQLTSVFTVTATSNDGCTSVQTFTQMVDPCTGIKLNDLENGVVFYPNPNSGEFMIDVRTEATIKIYDGSGRLLDFKKLEAGENNMHYSELPDGFYFIKIEEKDFICRKHFIKR